MNPVIPLFGLGLLLMLLAGGKAKADEQLPELPEEIPEPEPEPQPETDAVVMPEDGPLPGMEPGGGGGGGGGPSDIGPSYPGGGGGGSYTGPSYPGGGGGYSSSLPSVDDGMGPGVGPGPSISTPGGGSAASTAAPGAGTGPATAPSSVVMPDGAGPGTGPGTGPSASTDTGPSTGPAAAPGAGPGTGPATSPGGSQQVDSVVMPEGEETQPAGAGVPQSKKDIVNRAFRQALAKHVQQLNAAGIEEPEEESVAKIRKFFGSKGVPSSADVNNPFWKKSEREIADALANVVNSYQSGAKPVSAAPQAQTEPESVVTPDEAPGAPGEGGPQEELSEISPESLEQKRQVVAKAFETAVDKRQEAGQAAVDAALASQAEEQQRKQQEAQDLGQKQEVIKKAFDAAVDKRQAASEAAVNEAMAAAAAEKAAKDAKAAADRAAAEEQKRDLAEKQAIVQKAFNLAIDKRQAAVATAPVKIPIPTTKPKPKAAQPATVKEVEAAFARVFAYLLAKQEAKRKKKFTKAEALAAAKTNQVPVTQLLAVSGIPVPAKVPTSDLMLMPLAELRKKLARAVSYAYAQIDVKYGGGVASSVRDLKGLHPIAKRDYPDVVAGFLYA